MIRQTFIVEVTLCSKILAYGVPCPVDDDNDDDDDDNDKF